MTTETKVEAVAYTGQDEIDAIAAGITTACTFGTYSERQGRTVPLYSASALDALRGEVERWKSRYDEAMQARADEQKRADAAEQRVAELEAAAEPFVRFSSGERYIDLRMPTSAIERMRRLLRKDDALTKESP